MAPLRPKPRITSPEIPRAKLSPQDAYRLAVNTAIGCLDRAYRDAVEILHGPPPLDVPADMLERWNKFLSTLSRCSDSLCKLE